MGWLGLVVVVRVVVTVEVGSEAGPVAAVGAEVAAPAVDSVASWAGRSGQARAGGVPEEVDSATAGSGAVG